VVAAREAYIFEVIVLAAGAHALLRAGRAGVIAAFRAEKDIFELVHASVGEEERGVAVGDERGAADAAMAFAFKEAQEHFADLVAAHFLGFRRRHGFAAILAPQRWKSLRRW
jgi:hypothetical protein